MVKMRCGDAGMMARSDTLVEVMLLALAAEVERTEASALAVKLDSDGDSETTVCSSAETVVGAISTDSGGASGSGSLGGVTFRMLPDPALAGEDARSEALKDRTGAVRTGVILRVPADGGGTRLGTLLTTLLACGGGGGGALCQCFPCVVCGEEPGTTARWNATTGRGSG